MGLACSIAVSAFVYLQQPSILLPYAKLFMIATGVQTAFLILNSIHSSAFFRFGAYAASFCVVPSGFFTLVGLAKAADSNMKIAHQSQMIEGFRLSKKLVVGSTILNGIFFILISYFVSHVFIKVVLLAFISLGFMDALYRNKYAVVVFHKSCLTLKYSLFKPARTVQYSKIVQIKNVNKSIIALIENRHNKPVSHVIAHASDLESVKRAGVSVQVVLQKAVSPTHVMPDYNLAAASND